MGPNDAEEGERDGEDEVPACYCIPHHEPRERGEVIELGVELEVAREERQRLLVGAHEDRRGEAGADGEDPHQQVEAEDPSPPPPLRSALRHEGGERRRRRSSPGGGRRGRRKRGAGVGFRGRVADGDLGAGGGLTRHLNLRSLRILLLLLLGFRTEVITLKREGWLPGLKRDGDVNQLPTIAIVASYDTFGAAPALSVGSDSNGSGVVALLEIARLFSRLYSSPRTRGRYNLLFGLTSGGPYNYNGTLKWLRSFDQRLRESIDYAICLNSIGSWNNELWMHVSKPPENAYIKQVFESLSDVAGELGVKVGIKHKKINISNPRVAWEHEQFSRLRVTAVTISELPQAPELLESTGGLYDTRNAVDETAIQKSVKLVAESLARHIYGHQGKNIQIFADNSSLAVSPSYINAWVDLLSRTPRVAPFLSKIDPLITALKKELSEHTVEVNLQHDVLDGMFTFYDSSRASLSIYQVASVAFDLLLLLAVGSYLILLFSLLVIATRGLDDLLNIFRRPPPRKMKTA